MDTEHPYLIKIRELLVERRGQQLLSSPPNNHNTGKNTQKQQFQGSGNKVKGNKLRSYWAVEDRWAPEHPYLSYSHFPWSLMGEEELAGQGWQWKPTASLVEWEELIWSERQSPQPGATVSENSKVRGTKAIKVCSSTFG